MCGIAGFIDNQVSSNTNNTRIDAMLSSIVHRGPDDSGVWQEAGVCIGHRRLSIQDLSSSGHQPMRSSSGRYILVFNGEIYNYKLLRKDLRNKGITFRGHSDTEVLLALIQIEGLEKALIKCIGMFAIVVWDSYEKKLYLARDRFGEKPLYYGWHNGIFIFGSELKALMAHPKFSKTIDKKSLSLLVGFGYIQAPYSIFDNTYKLQQGSILVLDITESGNNLTKDSCGSNLISYWSPNKSLESEAVSIFKGSFDNAVDELEELMLDSVGLQMHADVPLGAFLSGGVDSSTIVSLMQKLTNRQVQTFTIGFDDARFNEATHSLSVASYLETNHTELYINDTDIQNIIPKLPFIYDEPFADPSQIPTYLVSQLAKQQVTVSLSGDGADEIFCGYNKYRLGQKISSIPLRRLWGGALKLLPWGVIEDIGAISPGTFEKRLKHERLEFISKLFLAKDNIKLAEILSKSHSHPERFTICNGSYNTVFDTSSYTNIPENYQRDAMALDRIGYLPENILTKVDRASMAVSLESRAPFLDHRICEFVAKLPRSYLSNGNDNKKILRELLYRYVPRSLVDRPKAGFSVPLADWLRGDLYEWAMELLQSDKNEDEFLNLANCRKTLLSHRRCERDYSPVLWPILMFQSWRKVWL